jgi:hypothetical protein
VHVEERDRPREKQPDGRPNIEVDRQQVVGEWSGEVVVMTNEIRMEAIMFYSIDIINNLANSIIPPSFYEKAFVLNKCC